MLLPDAPEVALAEVGAEERAGLEEQAGRVPTAEVVRMIESLGATISRAKRGGDPKLELELTFLKLARDYEQPPVEAFMARLEALERVVTNGGTNAAAPTPASRPEPSVTRTKVSTLSLRGVGRKRLGSSPAALLQLSKSRISWSSRRSTNLTWQSGLSWRAVSTCSSPRPT